MAPDDMMMIPDDMMANNIKNISLLAMIEARIACMDWHRGCILSLYTQASEDLRKLKFGEPNPFEPDIAQVDAALKRLEDTMKGGGQA